MPERRLPVDVEAAILGGDHGVLQFGGKSRERDPLRVFCIRPAGPDRHMATRRHAADVIAAAAGSDDGNVDPVVRTQDSAGGGGAGGGKGTRSNTQCARGHEKVSAIRHGNSLRGLKTED